MLRVLQFKSNEHSIIRTRSCQHGQYGPHRAARSKEVLLRTCSKYATLHFVLQNSVWKCHNASGRELPRQASSNDVQILSLLVADISDSMLHPVSFRFIPINTGVFIAPNSSIVRVLIRATSRSPWTRQLTHLSHSSPSEHLEQIVVARDASIYGARNRTEDTVLL